MKKGRKKRRMNERERKTMRLKIPKQKKKHTKTWSSSPVGELFLGNGPTLECDR